MFIEFFEEIESTIFSYNQDCPSKIKEAFQAIESLLQTKNGQEEIRSKFKYFILFKCTHYYRTLFLIKYVVLF